MTIMPDQMGAIITIIITLSPRPPQQDVNRIYMPETKLCKNR